MDWLAVPLFLGYVVCVLFLIFCAALFWLWIGKLIKRFCELVLPDQEYGGWMLYVVWPLILVLLFIVKFEKWKLDSAKLKERNQNNKLD